MREKREPWGLLCTACRKGKRGKKSRNLPSRTRTLRSERGEKRERKRTNALPTGTCDRCNQKKGERERIMGEGKGAAPRNCSA